MLVDYPTTKTLRSAYDGVLCCAKFKKSPSDFYVEEALHYELTGEGEHLFLFIEKVSLNTQDVKKILSERFGTPMKNISEAGQKDREATTRQWICMHWPIKKELPDFSAVSEFKVLDIKRHNKKLRTGAFGHNLFKLVIKDIHFDHSLIESRLAQIKLNGYPNYYGPQRFGNNQNNLSSFLNLVGGQRLKRHTRSLAISAARSFLFNQMLSKLIELQQWPLKTVTHGILWGKANKGHKDEIKPVAELVAGQYTELSSGLEKLGLEQSFRLLSVEPGNLEWRWGDDSTLHLEFCLPPGSFATALLREVFDLEEY